MIVLAPISPPHSIHNLPAIMPPIAIKDIRPGTVLYGASGSLMNSPDAVATKSVTGRPLGVARRDKHPLLVLAHDTKDKQMVVTYTTTFGEHKGSLAEITRLVPPARPKFIPVHPAPKEHDFDTMVCQRRDPTKRMWIWAGSKRSFTYDDVSSRSKVLKRLHLTRDVQTTLFVQCTA